MVDIKRKLFDKLKEFYHDKDFVVGVMSSVKNEDEAKVILNYIEHGEDVTVESIILLSLELSIERDKLHK